MPIRPENRGLYPPRAQWLKIRAEIMARADNRCEGWIDEEGEVYADEAKGRIRCGAVHSVRIARLDGRGDWIAWSRLAPSQRRRLKPVKVILTTAHLDHDPTHNDHSNLRALCQRCHNVYDREHRAQTRARTRREAQRQGGQTELWTGDDR